MKNSGDKPNLLFINHARAVSGAEISLELLLKSLDKKKFNVFLVIPPGDNGLKKRVETEAGITIITLPLLRFKRTKNIFIWLRYFTNLVLCAVKLIRVIKKNNISLVHSNTTNAHIYAALPGIVTGTPLVWHVRDKVPLGLTGRILVRVSKRIICISNCVAQQPSFRQSAKVNVIHNALDMNNWNALEEHHTIHTQYGLSTNCSIITQIGQLVPWKNHSDFILVAEQIVTKLKNVRFLIVGSDIFDDNIGYLGELRGLILAKNLTNFFIFKSFTDNVKDVLSETQVVFHPATNEPFGRVIIEAMALKKPVVAINSCGPSEIITNNVNGFLVDAGNHKAMASKIIELLTNNQLCASIGEAARARVAEKFDMPHYVKSVELIYKQVLPV